jgi:nicotinate-nucleotide adenylyltransferase
LTILRLKAGEAWPLWQQAVFYFGSFNPVHNGHLFWAEEARKKLGKAYVLWLPSARPPNRSWKQLLPFKHRFNMLQLALAEQPAHWLCPYEGELNSEQTTEAIRPTYTLETLKALCGLAVFEASLETPETATPKQSVRPALLLGEDTLLTLPTWYQAKTLAEKVHFVVAPRTTAQEAIATKPIVCKESDPLSLAEVTYLERPKVEVSATNVREYLKNGHSCQQWLPSSVEAYWQAHQLNQFL